MENSRNYLNYFSSDDPLNLYNILEESSIKRILENFNAKKGVNWLPTTNSLKVSNNVSKQSNNLDLIPNYFTNPQSLKLNEDVENRFKNVLSLVGDYLEEKKLEEEVLNEYLDELKNTLNLFNDDVNSLTKDFSKIVKENKNTQLSKDFKDDVINSWINLGVEKDEESASLDWDLMSEKNKLSSAIQATGLKYLNDEDKIKFLQFEDDEDRLSYLVTKLKANPLYLTEHEKYKDKLDLKAYNLTAGLFKGLDWIADKGKEIVSGTDENTKAFDTGDIVSNSIYKGVLKTTGYALWGLGKLGSGISGLLRSVGVGAYGWLTDSEELELDKKLNELEDAFIQKTSAKLKEALLKKSPEEKKKLADLFDLLSEKSATYKSAKGTDLLEMPEVEDSSNEEEVINAKVEKVAELLKRRELFGDNAVDKTIDNYWKNTTAQNQGAVDYITNTAGIAGTSFASDILSAIAIAGNVVNPYTAEEGYSDALLKHNYPMNWAAGIQEWGQDKFKTYKSIEDENSFISLRDIPDIVGQYGFTLGSKYITIAGSWAARKAATAGARMALKKNILGAMSRRAVWNKELREAIKAGIDAGRGTEEYTKALELINLIQSKRLYNLNLAVGGATGTAEGALNANETYKKFKEKNNQDASFDERALQIENASIENLEAFMNAAGYKRETLLLTREDGTIFGYSPELYELAKQELMAYNENERKRVQERVEDDALDAAATNFVANSLINGFLNVYLKESLLSKDVKAAARNMKGQTKGVLDLIDVVKDGKGWVARVKDGLKSQNPTAWKTIAKNGKQALKTIKNSSKSSFGEFLEEGGQDITDAISTAALEADLNKYLETVYDPQALEAFNTDLLNVLNAGFDAIDTSINNKEALRSGVFGFLSSMIGGVNYLGGINAYKEWNKSDAKVGSKQWLKDTGKNLLNTAGNLVDGAIIEAYRESQEEGLAARKLVDSVNEWLNNSVNLELITHLGGAIGFKKTLENDLIAGDTQAARDDKLGIAIENAFMLRALKGTLVELAYLKSIEDLASLSDLYSDVNKEANFGENDVFIGEDKQAASAIAAFRELNKLAESMSDLQVIQKMAENAQEFLELQKTVENYSSKIEEMYHEENLDPIVQQAYVLALIQLKKARERAGKLKHELKDIFDDDNENITEEQRALINKKSELDDESLDFLVEFGSIKNALKEREELLEEINKLETAMSKDDKTASNDELNNEQLKEKKRQLELQKTYLDERIAREQGKIIERDSQKTSLTQEETQEQKDKKIKEAEFDTGFTVGDMVNMGTQQLSYLLNNKKKFTEQQQKEIDKFIQLSRSLLAKQQLGNSDIADIELTDLDIVNSYTDLAALEKKSSTYDYNLYRYILNPQFLNATTLRLKNEHRKRTLKFIYKEDLKLRPNESNIEMLDRLLKKIDILKSNKSTYEDGNILESIINEDKVLNKLSNALKETSINVAKAVLDSGKWKDREDTANKALLGIKTLIASGLDLGLIKALLDNNDSEGLRKSLTVMYNNEFILNRQFRSAKIDEILKEDDNFNIDNYKEPLNLLILNIKEVLDTYYAKKNVDKSRGETQRITPKPITERKQELSDKPADVLLQQTGNKETSFIEVKTPGNTNNKELRAFLDEHKVSWYLKVMTNPSLVRFMVTKQFGKPVIFVVAYKDVRGSKLIKLEKTEGRFAINDYNYQIIGYIDHGDSSVLSKTAKETYSKLSNGESRILENNGKEIEFSINKIDSPKSVKDKTTSPETPPALNTQLSEGQIDDWVNNFVEKGEAKIKKKEDATGATYSEFSVKYDDYQIGIKKQNGLMISLFNVPLKGLKVKNKIIEDITVGEFISSTEYSNEDKVLALRNHDAFFDTFFSTWENFNIDELSNSGNARNIYLHLIGNFIYLGDSYKDSDGKTRSLSIGAAGNGINGNERTITVSSTDLSEHISIPLPSGEQKNQFDALRALQTIFLNTLNGGKGFQYHNLTFNGNVIGKKAVGELATKDKLNEKGIIKGLIQLGILEGEIPDAINRNIKLNNIFSINRPNPGSSNGNDANLAQSDNARPEEKKVPIKEKMKKDLKRELNEALKKAQAIVDRIILSSKKVNLPEGEKEDKIEEYSEDEDPSFYQGTLGEQYTRVTSTESAARGHNKKEVKLTGNKKVQSTAHGNTMDTVVRKAIKILKNSSELYGKEDAKELYDLLAKEKEFENGVPNYSEKLIILFLKQFIDFYNIAYELDWTIVPEGIKAFANLDVYQNGNKVGELPTAGTLDLLVYDKDGIFHIIDIKTKHHSSSTKNGINQSKEGWEIQVSTYQYLLLKQYPEMVFGENYVLPIEVFYSIPNLALTKEKDGMTVTYRVLDKVLKMEADDAPRLIKDDEYFKKILLPIEYNEPLGVDIERLNELQKALVKNKAEEAPTNLNTGLPEKTSIELLMKSVWKARRGRKGRGGEGQKSQRTIKQARFTDFINNHIAPINDFKINVFNNIKTKLKELIGNKKALNNLALSDLANTFFQGNIQKTKSIIKGLNITLENMPKIVANLLQYFNTYINNEANMISTVQRRQQMYKALYDYLKGSLNDKLFEDTLYNLNVESTDLPELIDYINSTDKENEARRIILKIETSLVHQKENADGIIKAIQNRIENMKTKLEFLNSNLASDMLSRRIQSIKNSANLGKYQLKDIIDKEVSMQMLLNGEDGVYGADKLLNHIRHNSNNTFFRNLAATLLRYIKQYNMVITVSLDDLMLNLEGESNGKNITIYKTSLDSYEHLERVILHEMLHSVLLISPLMKSKLQAIISKATANIARASGKTIKEVKQDFYGLTNIDEFVSEFFTNYAFLEMLKSITDNDNTNITNSIILKLLTIVSRKLSSLYDAAFKEMAQLLLDNSFESLKKTAQIIEDVSYIKHTFKNLGKDVLDLIKQRGISEEEFNNMTVIELEHLEECCK